MLYRDDVLHLLSHPYLAQHISLIVVAINSAVKCIFPLTRNLRLIILLFSSHSWAITYFLGLSIRLCILPTMTKEPFLHNIHNGPKIILLHILNKKEIAPLRHLCDIQIKEQFLISDYEEPD